MGGQNLHRVGALILAEEGFDGHPQALAQPPDGGQGRIGLVSFDLREHGFRHAGAVGEFLEGQAAGTALAADEGPDIGWGGLGCRRHDNFPVF